MRVRLGGTFEDEPLELGLPSDFRAHDGGHVRLHEPYATQLLQQAVARRPAVIDALRRLLAMADPSWAVSRMRDQRVLAEIVARVHGGQLWLKSPRRREAWGVAAGIAATQADTAAPSPRQPRSARAPTSARQSTAPTAATQSSVPTTENAAGADVPASPSPTTGQASGPAGAALPLGGSALAPTSAADTPSANTTSATTTAGAATESSSGSGGQSEGPTDLGTPFKPDKNKTGFIEIELVDVEGAPLAEKPFRIILPDGSRADGKLNKQGTARLEGFDPGDCAVIFQKISPAD